MTSKAKNFENGRLRVVRSSKVILGPLPKDRWPQGFWEDFAPDPDFPVPKPMPNHEFSLD